MVRKASITKGSTRAVSVRLTEGQVKALDRACYFYDMDRSVFMRLAIEVLTLGDLDQWMDDLQYAPKGVEKMFLEMMKEQWSGKDLDPEQDSRYDGYVNVGLKH